MNKKLLSLLITAGLVLGVSQASATDITIADWNAGAGFGGGPFGSGGEDNETEPGTIASQTWDMEAFAHVGQTLYIIGGYNMQSGASGGGGSIVPGMLTPGDLFIKVGGTQPPPNPTVNTGNVFNSVYDYTYVVDLTLSVGATGPLATVYNLASTSVLKTAVYDQFGANPWKYANDGSAGVRGNIGINYTSGLDYAATLALTGVSLVGGNHNVLAVDMNWLSVTAGTNVWFSYTMECGNDSLKGKDSGGFDRVPDGASSALLIGLGLAAMAFFGSRRR